MNQFPNESLSIQQSIDDLVTTMMDEFIEAPAKVGYFNSPDRQFYSGGDGPIMVIYRLFEGVDNKGLYNKTAQEQMETLNRLSFQKIDPEAAQVSGTLFSEKEEIDWKSVQGKFEIQIDDKGNLDYCANEEPWQNPVTEGPHAKKTDLNWYIRQFVFALNVSRRIVFLDDMVTTMMANKLFYKFSFSQYKSTFEDAPSRYYHCFLELYSAYLKSLGELLTKQRKKYSSYGWYKRWYECLTKLITQCELTLRVIDEEKDYPNPNKEPYAEDKFYLELKTITREKLQRRFHDDVNQKISFLMTSKKLTWVNIGEHLNEIKITVFHLFDDFLSQGELKFVETKFAPAQMMAILEQNKEGLNPRMYTSFRGVLQRLAMANSLLMWLASVNETEGCLGKNIPSLVIENLMQAEQGIALLKCLNSLLISKVIEKKENKTRIDFLLPKLERAIALFKAISQIELANDPSIKKCYQHVNELTRIKSKLRQSGGAPALVADIAENINAAKDHISELECTLCFSQLQHILQQPLTEKTIKELKVLQGKKPLKDESVEKTKSPSKTTTTTTTTTTSATPVSNQQTKENATPRKARLTKREKTIKHMSSLIQCILDVNIKLQSKENEKKLLKEAKGQLARANRRALVLYPKPTEATEISQSESISFQVNVVSTCSTVDCLDEKPQSTMKQVDTRYQLINGLREKLALKRQAMEEEKQRKKDDEEYQSDDVSFTEDESTTMEESLSSTQESDPSDSYTQPLTAFENLRNSFRLTSNEEDINTLKRMFTEVIKNLIDKAETSQQIMQLFGTGGKFCSHVTAANIDIGMFSNLSTTEKTLVGIKKELWCCMTKCAKNKILTLEIEKLAGNNDKTLIIDKESQLYKFLNTHSSKWFKLGETNSIDTLRKSKAAATKDIEGYQSEVEKDIGKQMTGLDKLGQLRIKQQQHSNAKRSSKRQPYQTKTSTG